VSSKIESEYRDLTSLPSALLAQQGGPRPAAGAAAGPSAPPPPQGTKRKLIEGPAGASSGGDAIDDIASSKAYVMFYGYISVHLTLFFVTGWSANKLLTQRIKSQHFSPNLSSSAKKRDLSSQTTIHNGAYRASSLDI
jgi:hypothetical protein